jgi:hypothetical protein
VYGDIIIIIIIIIIITSPAALTNFDCHFNFKLTNCYFNTVHKYALQDDDDDDDDETFFSVPYAF